MSVNQKGRVKHPRIGVRDQIVMKQQKKVNEKNSGRKATDEERIKTTKCHGFVVVILLIQSQRANVLLGLLCLSIY